MAFGSMTGCLISRHMRHSRAWSGVAVCWVLGSLTPGRLLATTSCCRLRIFMVSTPDCACAILTWTKVKLGGALRH